MSDVFNQTKNRISSIKINKETDCIRTIVLNISEYCNLKCSVCPRSKEYPNQKLFMNNWIALILRLRLEELDFDGVVSISGMGEPCFNPDLILILKTLTSITDSYSPKYKVEILTNGFPDIDYKEISDMGVRILVSIHDINNLNYLKFKFSDIPVVFRNHDPSSSKSELRIVNRAGYMNDDSWKEFKYINNCCNYPFYKMIIDYDGSYLLCPDDWKRVTRRERYNIKTLSIEEYFCKVILNTKKELAYKGRKNLYPCKYCDIEGTLMGENTVKWFKSHHSKFIDYKNKPKIKYNKSFDNK